jgi:hypothetical protein
MNLIEVIKAQWDRTAAIVASAVGGIILILGWVGVSGTSFLGEQTPYIISGGIGGLFFLGLGATLWISADLRDEWRKLDRIEEALGDGTLRWAEVDVDPEAGAGHPPLHVSPAVPAHAADSSGPPAGVGPGSELAGDYVAWPPGTDQDWEAATTETPAVVEADPARTGSPAGGRRRSRTSVAAETTRSATARVKAPARAGANGPGSRPRRQGTPATDAPRSRSARTAR